MKKIIRVMLFFTLFLSGCSSETVSSNQLNIVTGVYSTSLLTEEIGGQFVNVSSIYPDDSDIHSYELTPQQVVELQEADLVILVNDEIESNIYNALEDYDNLLLLEEHTETEEHNHSHSWLSPAHATEMANIITNKLISIDSANQSTYQTNSDNLIANLTSIDEDYGSFAANQTKPLIITHDAYSSLYEDYGFNIITLYGAHHDDEPTTKEISEAIDQINSNNITTILCEQNDKENQVMEQIATESGADIAIVDNMESKDSASTYTSISEIYQNNLKAFEKAGL